MTVFWGGVPLVSKRRRGCIDGYSWSWNGCHLRPKAFKDLGYCHLPQRSLNFGGWVVFAGRLLLVFHSSQSHALTVKIIMRSVGEECT